jgi:hypothetical protein
MSRSVVGKRENELKERRADEYGEQRPPTTASDKSRSSRRPPGLPSSPRSTRRGAGGSRRRPTEPRLGLARFPRTGEENRSPRGANRERAGGGGRGGPGEPEPRAHEANREGETERARQDRDVLGQDGIPRQRPHGDHEQGRHEQVLRESRVCLGSAGRCWPGRAPPVLGRAGARPRRGSTPSRADLPGSRCRWRRFGSSPRGFQGMGLRVGRAQAGRARRSPVSDASVEASAARASPLPYRFQCALAACGQAFRRA